MKPVISFFCLVLLAVPGLVVAQSAAAQSAPPAEEFVATAGVANMFEIQSSVMAKSSGESADVKAFADQMIADHTKAGEELADASSVTVPDKLDAKHQGMIDELSGLKGVEFDRRYVEMQVQAHEDAVALFTAYSQSGDDADLKAFAANTLPVLQQHYDHIQEIAKKSS